MVLPLDEYDQEIPQSHTEDQPALWKEPQHANRLKATITVKQPVPMIIKQERKLRYAFQYKDQTQNLHKPTGGTVNNESMIEPPPGFGSKLFANVIKQHTYAIGWT